MKPDWALWLHVPSVTLEEAVCLSLDADPAWRKAVPSTTSTSLPSKPEKDRSWAAPVVPYHGDRLSRQERSELLAHLNPALLTPDGQQRLQQLRRHFDQRSALLPPFGIPDYYGSLPERRVTLLDFARWAGLVEWTVPSQLSIRTPSNAQALPEEHHNQSPGATTTECPLVSEPHNAPTSCPPDDRNLNRVHRSRRRQDVFQPLVEDAVRACGSVEPARVWATLCEMADRRPPPPPLIARDDTGALKYRKTTSDLPGFVDLPKLRKRLRRIVAKGT